MADSDINLETHFPDGSPRPQRLTADTTYEEFLEWFNGSSIQGAMESYYSHRPETMNALSQNSPGYERNEAGRYVNQAGEELFYYTGPDYENEKKNGAGLNADAAYVTMDEIRARYEEDTVLHKHFDSVDQYVSYITDRQDLIDSGQIMDKWERSNQLWHDTFIRRHDGRGGPNGQYIADITEAERRRVEDAERAAEAGLAEQYGIQTSITDDNGNQLRWNGTGYSLIERYKEDDKWGRTIAGAGAGLIVGGALAPYLGSLAGAAPAAGAAGPAAPLLSSAVANGIAAGAGSAASQGLLTGSIDPGSVLASAVLAGVNPGGYVADNYAPWYGADPVTGDKSWMLGGAPPSSFYGGLVSGSVNDLVSTAIKDGEIDLEGALQAGLISGGTNAALNTYDEWQNNSQEAIADRLQHQDPYTYPNTEAGRAAAMAKALEDPLLNTTDFGAIIGDEGLLPFIPRADLGFIRAITDPIGDALGGLLNGFELGDVMVLPDGTKIPMEGMTDAEYQNYTLNEGGQVVSQSTVGLLNNPVVDGAADLLGGLLPSGGSQLSQNLQTQKDKFGKEWDDLYANEYQLLDKNGLPTGQLTVAGQAAKNDFIQLKMDTLGSFYFENSGGLNEDYSWSPNPRGQSELWGTVTGIPGLYSTGSINSSLPDGNSGTVTPPLNPDGTSVTPIMNLNGEIDPVGYAEYVASLDPSSAVLPSNDESALRNWWFQQYYDYLNQNGGNGSDASVDLGVNTEVDTGVSTGGATDTPVVNTDAGGDVTTNTGGDATTDTGGDATTDTGGDVTTDTGGDVTNNTGGDLTTDTGGNTSTDNTVDTGNNSTPANNVTPVYGLPINDDGTVTLPGGVTVSSDVADSVYGQMNGDEVYSGSSTQPTQPGGGTLPSNNLNFGGGNNGLPPVWTELFGYTKVSPYQKARLKVLDGMLSGMAGGAVGNMNALNFGANKDPYQKIGKSLIDAGMEPRG